MIHLYPNGLSAVSLCCVRQGASPVSRVPDVGFPARPGPLLRSAAQAPPLMRVEFEAVAHALRALNVDGSADLLRERHNLRSDALLSEPAGRPALHSAGPERPTCPVHCTPGHEQPKQPPEPPLAIICIAGPTGAGKTAASLALADAFSAGVINADSRQMYRDFPLVTAQPTALERETCPHLLFGRLATEDKLGAGDYARQAAGALRDQAEQGRTPLLVGGTGLYFRSLLQGMAPIPPVPPEIAAFWQQACDARGSQALHEDLRAIDPAYAARIHPNDRQRVTRALEVWQATGRPFSWWHAQPVQRPPYRAVKVGIALPMDELEPRLRLRIDAMLEAGALDEARTALERCADPTAPGWSGIGCAELFQYLQGNLDLDACRELWFRNTRAYAKRQYTWFRADPDITWFRPEQTREILDHVTHALTAFGR